MSQVQAASHGPEHAVGIALRRMERRERQWQLVLGRGADRAGRGGDHGLVRVHQAEFRARVGRQVHSAWLSLWCVSPS